MKSFRGDELTLALLGAVSIHYAASHAWALWKWKDKPNFHRALSEKKLTTAAAFAAGTVLAYFGCLLTSSGVSDAMCNLFMSPATFLPWADSTVLKMLGVGMIMVSSVMDSSFLSSSPFNLHDQKLGGAVVFSRHPIYTSVLIASIGFTLATANLWVGIAWGALSFVCFKRIPSDEVWYRSQAAMSQPHSVQQQESLFPRPPIVGTVDSESDDLHAFSRSLHPSSELPIHDSRGVVSRSLHEGDTDKLHKITQAASARLAGATEGVKQTLHKVSDTASHIKDQLLTQVPHQVSAAAVKVGEKAAIAKDGVQQTAANIGQAAKDTAYSAQAKASELSSSAKRKARKAKEGVKSSASSLAHSVQDTAYSAKEGVKSTTASIAHSVQDTAYSAKEGVKSTAYTIAEKASDVKEGVQRQAAVITQVAKEKIASLSQPSEGPGVKERVQEKATLVKEYVVTHTPAIPAPIQEASAYVTETVRTNAPIVKHAVKLTGEQIIESAKANAPAAKQALKTAGERIYETAKANAPAAKEALIHAGETIVETAKANAPAVKEGLKVAGEKIVETAKVVANYAVTHAPAVKEGVSSTVHKISEKAPEWKQSTVETLHHVGEKLPSMPSMPSLRSSKPTSTSTSTTTTSAPSISAKLSNAKQRVVESLPSMPSLPSLPTLRSGKHEESSETHQPTAELSRSAKKKAKKLARKAMPTQERESTSETYPESSHLSSEGHTEQSSLPSTSRLSLAKERALEAANSAAQAAISLKNQIQGKAHNMYESLRDTSEEDEREIDQQPDTVDHDQREQPVQEHREIEDTEGTVQGIAGDHDHQDQEFNHAKSRTNLSTPRRAMAAARKRRPVGKRAEENVPSKTHQRHASQSFDEFPQPNYEEDSEDIPAPSAAAKLRSAKNYVADSVSSAANTASAKIGAAKDSVTGAVASSYNSAASKLGSAKDSIAGGIANTYNAAAAKIGDATHSVSDTITHAKERVLGAAPPTDDSLDTSKKAKKKKKSKLTKAKEAVQQGAHAVSDSAAAVHSVGDTITHAKESARSGLHGIVDAAYELVRRIVMFFYSKLAQLHYGAKHAADSALSEARGAAHHISDSVHQAADSARDTVQSAKDSVKQAAYSATDTVKQAAYSAKDSAKQAAYSAKDTVQHAAYSAKDTVQHAADSAKQAAYSAKETAKQAAYSAKATAKSAAASVKDALPTSLKPASPTSVPPAVQFKLAGVKQHAKVTGPEDTQGAPIRSTETRRELKELPHTSRDVANRPVKTPVKNLEGFAQPKVQLKLAEIRQGKRMAQPAYQPAYQQQQWIAPRGQEFKVHKKTMRPVFTAIKSRPRLNHVGWPTERPLLDVLGPDWQEEKQQEELPTESGWMAPRGAEFERHQRKMAPVFEELTAISGPVWHTARYRVQLPRSRPTFKYWSAPKTESFEIHRKKMAPVFAELTGRSWAPGWGKSLKKATAPITARIQPMIEKAKQSVKPAYNRAIEAAESAKQAISQPSSGKPLTQKISETAAPAIEKLKNAAASASESISQPSSSKPLTQKMAEKAAPAVEKLKRAAASASASLPSAPSLSSSSSPSSSGPSVLQKTKETVKPAIQAAKNKLSEVTSGLPSASEVKASVKAAMPAMPGSSSSKSSVPALSMPSLPSLSSSSASTDAKPSSSTSTSESEIPSFGQTVNELKEMLAPVSAIPMAAAEKLKSIWNQSKEAVEHEQHAKPAPTGQTVPLPTLPSSKRPIEFLGEQPSLPTRTQPISSIPPAPPVKETSTIPPAPPLPREELPVPLTLDVLPPSKPVQERVHKVPPKKRYPLHRMPGPSVPQAAPTLSAAPAAPIPSFMAAAPPAAVAAAPAPAPVVNEKPASAAASKVIRKKLPMVRQVRGPLFQSRRARPSVMPAFSSPFGQQQQQQFTSQTSSSSQPSIFGAGGIPVAPPASEGPIPRAASALWRSQNPRPDLPFSGVKKSPRYAELAALESLVAPWKPRQQMAQLPSGNAPNFIGASQFQTQRISAWPMTAAPIAGSQEGVSTRTLASVPRMPINQAAITSQPLISQPAAGTSGVFLNPALLGLGVSPLPPQTVSSRPPVEGLARQQPSRLEGQTVDSSKKAETQQAQRSQSFTGQRSIY